MSSDPQQPQPDTKDWTWTLRRRCPECGFDAGSVAAGAVPTVVDDAVTRFTARLASTDAARRPAPQVWSPLEYACHVRDVCELFDERLRAMLAEDDPQFANWDQDETAVDERYWAQDPARVADELTAAAARINATIGALDADQLGRPGRRSDGSVFTVGTLTQYFAHDLAHHVHDVDG